MNNYRIVNLRSFLQAYLVPWYEWDTVHKLRGHNVGQLHSNASLLEFFWWVIFGVRYGCFPKTESISVLECIEPRLKEAKSSLQHYIDDKMFAPELEDRLNAFLAHNYLQDLEAEEECLPFGPAFQSILILESKFSRQAVAQCFVTSLTFSLDTFWEEMIEEDFSVDNFTFYLTNEVELPLPQTKEVIIAGFFHALQHMGQYKEFFESRRNHPSFPGMLDGNWRLEQDARKISKWRVNLLAHNNVSNRFSEIAKLASDFIHSELSQQSDYDVAEFVTLVTQIADNWRQDGVASMHAYGLRGSS